MRTVKRILSPVLLVLLLWGTAGAITPDEIIDIRTYSGTDNIAAGSDFRLAVEMRLLKDWHINSNTPTNEFAIPTEVIFKELPGITITRIIYPPAKVEVIPKANLTIDYYDGSSAILVEGRAAENLAPGRHALHGTFS